jgi:hypothetical protein
MRRHRNIATSLTAACCPLATRAVQPADSGARGSSVHLTASRPCSRVEAPWQVHDRGTALGTTIGRS